MTATVRERVGPWVPEVVVVTARPQAAGAPLQFEARDRTGGLQWVMDRLECAGFLESWGYRWVIGSQGVYVREPPARSRPVAVIPWR